MSQVASFPPQIPTRTPAALQASKAQLRHMRTCPLVIMAFLQAGQLPCLNLE